MNIQFKFTDDIFSKSGFSLRENGLVLFKGVIYKMKDDRDNLLGTNMRIKLMKDVEEPSSKVEGKGKTKEVEISWTHLRMLRDINLDFNFTNVFN